jgi:Ca2+/H+ antiporter
MSILMVAGNSLAFILLSLSFLAINSESLAQSTNTTTTNTTNATAASAGEVSPITVVMPTGSAAAVRDSDMNQTQ